MLPEQLLSSLQGTAGFDQEAFEKVHASGQQITSVRLNTSKASDIRNRKSPVPWAEQGYYLETRPSFTFDPLFHAGCYYVQEASSMFLEQALKQTVDLAQPLKVLDLCAAPGGKSTHIQSLLSPGSLLVSNEVIRSRVTVLKDNIIKWGGANAMVTNNDPKDFARLEGYFDVIVVDAPCSGSGLFRRDPDAISEWSENNVQLCSQRQQRILADVWPALKENGMLVYSTCSYSREEDEEMADWLVKHYAVESRELSIEKEWGITPVMHNGLHGYRFWPDKVNGEGFFIACFQKKEVTREPVIKMKKKAERLTKQETAIVSPWINAGEYHFINHQHTVYAWPGKIAPDFDWLLGQLRVVYSGTIIGELVRDKLVPDHALAMSPMLADAIRRTELDEEQAIRYLQRKNIFITAAKGWQVVTCQEHPLGWINVLHNRVNNYYPKELRILKER